jgi:hypothetical protein
LVACLYSVVNVLDPPLTGLTAGPRGARASSSIQSCICCSKATGRLAPLSIRCHVMCKYLLEHVVAVQVWGCLGIILDTAEGEPCDTFCGQLCEACGVFSLHVSAMGCQEKCSIVSRPGSPPQVSLRQHCADSQHVHFSWQKQLLHQLQI